MILRDGRKLIGVFRSYDQFGASKCVPSRSRDADGVLTSLTHRSSLHNYPTPSNNTQRNLRRLLRSNLLAPISTLRYMTDSPISTTPSNISANFLLESTIERLHYKLEFADKDLGESPLSPL